MELGGQSRLADRRVSEWFLNEKVRRAQERDEAVALRGRHAVLPVVTISRQYGAGGHTVAGTVAERLGPKWQVWDREIIEAMAHSADVRHEMIEALDEKTRSWIDEMAADLLNVPAMEPFAYRRHLAQVLLALAQQGHKIIVGRGANFILKDALNVRLQAPIEFRVQQRMQVEGLTHADVLKKLHRIDRERADFTRRVFDRDIHDPAGYDLIIQTDGISFDVAAGAIVGAAHAMFGGPV